MKSVNADVGDSSTVARRVEQYAATPDDFHDGDFIRDLHQQIIVILDDPSDMHRECEDGLELGARAGMLAFV
jgi:hypothetical protein